ncbi:putative odorant receptor 85e isoform X3 [Tenebrio molitor]|uniref:putative odorant receptor 85e isoform X3 n=1 Tax=Tenebrio molitor TaxID=7067 RepID=UPI0036247BF0
MSKLKYLNGAITVLKWTVLYPIDKENSPLKKFFYFTWALFFISSFVTSVIQCVMFLLTTEFDLLKEGMVIMNAAIYITLFINFFIFYYKSDSLVKLVHIINETFVDETDNEIDKITMKEASDLTNKLSYCWTMSVVASGLFSGFLPLYIGDRNIMPIPGWFPYDYTKSPQYELSYIWQIFCQINLGLIYGASDMIYPSMTIVIGQQFKILANNFSNNVHFAFVKSGLSTDTVKDFKVNSQHQSLVALMQNYKDVFSLMQDRRFKQTNREYLCKNIRHHQMLIKCCHDLNDIMSLFLLAKISAVTFNTIFIVFTLITSGDRTMIVGLCCYAFFGNTELFIYNYGGQILIEGADILWTVYECPWYLCDLSFQKIFLFAQMKISKTVQTKAGNYFSMSAPTFISFIRCVFSYAAILKEVTNFN